MKDKRKLSTILRTAAEKIHDGNGYASPRKRMSCLVADTEDRGSSINAGSKGEAKAWSFLYDELGAYVGYDDLDMEEGPKKQAIRYAWLMFAADLADEWGIR